MSLAADATEIMIGTFGEEVTVHPQSSDVPENSDDPMYFEQSQSSEPSFTLEVRVYSSPSQDMLETYGFDEDTKAIIYETENKVEEGDEVEYNGQTFIVRRTETNQIGSGPYVWVHDLVGV